MSAFENKIQALMDEVYSEWQKEENKGKNKNDILNDFSAAHQIAVVFGNFNYQVENGGIDQWISNGYFHDDSEKLIKYLEAGTELDDRFQIILDKIYKLDQYAQETDCDRYGDYYDPDNDGDSSFIGEMINGDAFDSWYYERCGKDDWWKTVCGIIDKVEGSTLVHENELDGGDAVLSYPLQVYIENVHDDRIGGFTMPLPTTIEKLQPFFDGAEIKGWQDAEISAVYSDIKGLGDTLTETIHKTMTPNTLDELNYLAARMNILGEQGLEIFAAVTETKREKISITEIINLTFDENINRFDLWPVFNEKEYGDLLVNQFLSDEHAEAFNRLKDSEDPADRALASHIEKLEKHTDYKAFGRTTVTEENGVFAERGYVIGGEGLEEIYKGTQDIPAEYRIFTKPDEIYRSPMKLDDADIAATIMQLSAIGCVSLSGTPDDLKTILNGQDRDYLLFVNKERVFVTPVLEAYKHGKISERMVKHWAGIPGTSFFAIRVNDRNDLNGRGVVGDFIELNMKALLTNITRHAVTADRIEAVKADGFSKSYDMEAWSKVSQNQRNEIKDIIHHYPENELKKAEKQCASFMGANEMASEAVSAEVFISAVNTAFMANAENPQPDMIRISNEAAKEILARGEADVYRLTPSGTEKLAAIESMRPLCFAQYRDLAIKKEDIAALDKWAGRKVGDIMRKAEREERGKNKNKGEEL